MPPTGGLSIAEAARSIQPGELVVLTISTLVQADSLRVRAFNRDVPTIHIGPLQWRALVGIDLDTPAGTYPVAIEARAGSDTLQATHELLVKPRRFPARALRVDEAFVNPPAAVRDRIARETRELQELWGRSAPEPQWSDLFVRPVTDPANSRFGTRSVFNGQPRSQHTGADFLSPAGTPIKAPNAGRVTGPHLHWAVRVGAARIDPLSLLALLGGNKGG